MLDNVLPKNGGRLEFWTRLNPYDWVSGVSDPEALTRLFDSGRLATVELRFHRRLHAKFFAGDERWAWVGSPNLTRQAFEENVEILCALDQRQEIERFHRWVLRVREDLAPVNEQWLQSYLSVTRDIIAAAAERGISGESEDLKAAIELLDEVSAPRVRAAPPALPSLEDFIRYCKTLRRHSPIADVVIRRHEGENNLQGHVKQCYYGCARFLRTSHAKRFLVSLSRHPLADLLSLEEEVEMLEAWGRFLDTHARAKDGRLGYSFSTLRTILPESLGGYTVGGGGASSTLKRVLPLVARFFIRERGNEGG